MKAPMSGWIAFAAVMMLVIGTLDFFEGLIAIFRDRVLRDPRQPVDRVRHDDLGLDRHALGDRAAPGRACTLGGAGWARWVTIVLVSLNTLVQLSWLGSTGYPLWSLVIVTLNIIVVYALCVRWEGYPEQAT